MNVWINVPIRQELLSLSQKSLSRIYWAMVYVHMQLTFVLMNNHKQFVVYHTCSRFCHFNQMFPHAGSVYQTCCPKHDGENNWEPQRHHACQRGTCLGPVHNSAIKRLCRPENVSHGLSRPEFALLNYCIQLKKRGEKKSNWTKSLKVFFPNIFVVVLCLNSIKYFYEPFKGFLKAWMYLYFQKSLWRFKMMFNGNIESSRLRKQPMFWPRAYGQ